MLVSPEIAFAYIDANYVRSELAKAGQPEYFNPYYLRRYLQTATVDGRPISADRFFFYDAIDEDADPAQRSLRQEYLQKVEELPFTSVVTGFVRPGKKKRRQQKAVDVQIAVDALEAAWSGRTRAVILVAGDADFCPLADAVRRTGAFFFAFGYQNSMSSELRHSADYAGFLPDPAEGLFKPF